MLAEELQAEELQAEVGGDLGVFLGFYPRRRSVLFFWLSSEVAFW